MADQSAPIKVRQWERRYPTYLAWCPGDGEDEGDAREVEAHDAEQAAEDLVEVEDPADSHRCAGAHQVVEVHVRPRDGGEVEVYEVSGECVPHYSARRVR